MSEVEQEMEYRRLGKSGLQVSRLSLGSWLTFGKQMKDHTADRMMGVAYDHGINFFDNAEIYARGEAERVMGKILRVKHWPRDSYIISSKAFFGSGGKLPTQIGLHRKHLVEACNDALQRLQVDYLDLFFCHRPDKSTPIEETVWTMHNLITQGKVLYWGTSEWSAQEIMEAHRIAERHHLIGPVVEQPEYNMFRREKVEVEYEQIYKTVGLGTTTWSPLASGLLTGKHNDGLTDKNSRLQMQGLEWLKDRTLEEQKIKKVKKLMALAEKLEVTPAQMAIAWCLKSPWVSTVILGASKVEQLEENIGALAAQEKLTDKAMDQIAKILDNTPYRPPY